MSDLEKKESATPVAGETPAAERDALPKDPAVTATSTTDAASGESKGVAEQTTESLAASNKKKDADAGDPASSKPADNVKVRACSPLFSSSSLPTGYGVWPSLGSSRNLGLYYTASPIGGL